MNDSIQNALRDLASTRKLETVMGEMGPQALTQLIVVTNLKGYKKDCATKQLHELAAKLNLYYKVLVPVVMEYGGDVDNLMGDLALLTFGIDTLGDKAAAIGVRCAMQVSEAFRRAELSVAIGVSYGEVLYGAFGMPGSRMTVTAVGDVVNRAFRLAARGAPGEVRAIPELRDLLPEGIGGKDVDGVDDAILLEA